MVLTNNQAEVNPKGFFENRKYNSFMVLDTSSIIYPDEKEVFGYSIEILNLIRVAKIANKMCASFKSDFQINTDIYYNVIDCVLGNHFFTNNDLIKYFETEQTKEEFLTFSKSLVDIEKEFYLPYEVDFILLGIDIESYFDLDQAKKEEISDKYGAIACEVRSKEIEIEDFIVKARDLMNTLCVNS